MYSLSFINYTSLINQTRVTFLIGSSCVNLYPAILSLPVDIKKHNLFKTSCSDHQCSLGFISAAPFQKKVIDTFPHRVLEGRRGRERMVVGFTATYAISAYHH
jgi:hypothetical protein